MKNIFTAPDDNSLVPFADGMGGTRFARCLKSDDYPNNAALD